MGNTASANFAQVVSGIKNAPIDESNATQTFMTMFPAENVVGVMEIFSTIQPHDVRMLRKQYPRNLSLIIVEAIAILLDAAHSHTPRSRTRALNAIRVLTRLMPMLQEQTAENAEFVDNLFWQNKMPTETRPAQTAVTATATTETTSDATAIAAANAGAEESKSDTPAVVTPSGAVEWIVREGSSPDLLLGSQLVRAAMRLLFCPELTIDSVSYDAFSLKIASFREKNSTNGGEDGADAPHDADTAAGVPVPDECNAVWPMLLWSAGISFPLVSPTSTAEMLQNRVDILRLLLALCSGPLYEAASPTSPTKTRFLDELTSAACPFAPTLFYSLINTTVAYDPVGWGVPYASAVFGDQEQPVVNMCVQLLLLFLDYAPLQTQPADASNTATDAAGEDCQPQLYAQFNIYRSLLAGLSDPTDFIILYESITRLLATVPGGDGTLLPHSIQQISCYQEILVLLWKLLDENPAFMQHVLAHADVSALITPMLYLMWAGRNDVTRVGLLHLCTFILLLVSGERTFAIGLNKKFTAKLPADIPLFEGSHADLMIIVLHKLIVDGSPKLSTLYSCFLTVIANISPYARSLSLVASSKLVNLLELFSTPAFLFARPNNHSFILQLVEAYNNIVQYSYESNGVFIYTLLRRHEVFDRLTSMSVSDWRKQQADKQRADKRRTSSSAAATLNVTVAQTAAETESAPAQPSADDANQAEWVAHNAGPDGAGAFAENAAVAPLAAADQASEPSASSTREGSVSVGAGGWVPTDEWFAGVKKQVPLGTITRLLQYLQPLIQEFVTSRAGSADDETVVDFIKATTLVGILPVPHPILVRRYTPNQWTSLWFTTFIYSTIFLHVCRDVPLWDATAIRLFQITIAAA